MRTVDDDDDDDDDELCSHSGHSAMFILTVKCDRFCHRAPQCQKDVTMGQQGTCVTLLVLVGLHWFTVACDIWRCLISCFIGLIFSLN